MIPKKEKFGGEITSRGGTSPLSKVSGVNKAKSEKSRWTRGELPEGRDPTSREGQRDDLPNYAAKQRKGGNPNIAFFLTLLFNRISSPLNNHTLHYKVSILPLLPFLTIDSHPFYNILISLYE